MRHSKLPLYVGTLLLPLNAAGQSSAFDVGSEVTVREDSFACKET